jgi:hypothetical protein
VSRRGENGHAIRDRDDTSPAVHGITGQSSTSFAYDTANQDHKEPIMLARSWRCIALVSVLLGFAACHPTARDDRAAANQPASSASASVASFDPASDESYRRHRCGPGIEACTAAQAGQACNPDNLNIVCEPQSNGSFCCLAVAH